MSKQNVGGNPAFIAGEDLEAYRRVKLSAGSGNTVVYADEDEAAIGITQEKVNSGDNVTVMLDNIGGTRLCTVAEALSAGATLYGADDGKLQDTDPGSGTPRATALEAATAAGDIIEVLPL